MRVGLAAMGFAATTCYSERAPPEAPISRGDRPWAARHRAAPALQPHRRERLSRRDARAGPCAPCWAGVTAPCHGVRVRLGGDQRIAISARSISTTTRRNSRRRPIRCLPDPALHRREPGLRANTPATRGFARAGWAAGRAPRQPALGERQRLPPDPAALRGRGALPTRVREARALAAGYFDQVRTTSGDTSDLRLTTLRAAWNPLAGAFARGLRRPARPGGEWCLHGLREQLVSRARRARPKGGLRASTRHRHSVPRRVRAAAALRDGDSRIDARYWRAGRGRSRCALDRRATTTR